jgi:hypothetical protein
MRNLAVMQSTQDMLAYAYTGEARHQARPQQAWAMSAQRIASGQIDMRCSAFWCLKAYNEDYYMWPYVLAKYLGL